MMSVTLLSKGTIMSKTILQQYYPAYRMHEICRLCRGNADKTLGYFRCKACKQSKKDYETKGLQYEREEFEYLHLTWLKCKGYKQITTGIAKLDFLLEMLFGKPHDRDWRNYSKTKVRVEMSKFVILRTVTQDRIL